MSSSGAAQITAAYKSGRCVSAAPTSSPPLLVPMMPSADGVEFNGAGLIPTSLLRWELTGKQPPEVARVLSQP